MRLLTFQIGDYKMALPSEAVTAVGKPFRDGTVRQVDLFKRVGVRPGSGAVRPAITCSLGDALYEFTVDRILNLEDYQFGQLKPWPRALPDAGLFSGVVDIGATLFLIISIDQMGAVGHRAKR
jgi:chemotaxis signal transduction protein